MIALIDKKKIPLAHNGEFIVHYTQGKLRVSDNLVLNPHALSGAVHTLLSRVSIFRRVLRLGIHLYEMFNDYHIVVAKEGVLTYNSNGDFLSVFSDYKGTRPLNLCHFNGSLFFGEYFANRERTEVSIFKTSDGVNWEKVYCFSKGEIRHIHGIIDSKDGEHMLILTGDSDKESAIYIADSSFTCVKRIFGGSQKARAVQIFVEGNKLIIPMDSPLEKNVIGVLDKSSRTYTKLREIRGSAFHAVKVNDLYMVTTVTEPSSVNIVDMVYVYVSLNGTDWFELNGIQKDFFPLALQRITRYSELKILPGLYQERYIVCLGRSLKSVSEGLILLDYVDIYNTVLRQGCSE